jgi:hypothetical protein
LAARVTRVIWRDSLAKIADTKIIGIGIEWFIWYKLTDCLKTKQIWRRATQSKSCLLVENMAFIFIFKWKSIYNKTNKNYIVEWNVQAVSVV